MNRFFLSLLCKVLVLCQGFGQSDFKLAGQINGMASNANVFFLKGTGEVDSFNVDAKNGRFNFQGKLNEPFPAVIILGSPTNIGDKQKQVFLWIDNSNICLIADYATFNKATITGSNEATEFRNFLKRLDSLERSTEELHSQYKTAVKNYYNHPDKQDQAANDRISELVTLSVNSANLLDSMKTQLIIQFMQQHPSFYEGLAEIYRRRGGISIKTIKYIYQKSSAEVKKFKYGKLLSQYIENYKGISIGQEAPDFTINDINGAAISLKSYRGKYVLLEFWGSWCSPCRRENPEITKLYEKYKDKGFEVIGIGMDSTEKLAKAIKEDKITWKNLVVVDRFDSKIAAQYGVWFAPYNVLIDPKGIVIATELKEVGVKAGAKKLSEQLHQIFGK